MEVSEQERHDLHTKLIDVIGAREAESIMKLLPPVGWADVARKSDLSSLGERMDVRLAATEGRIDHLAERMDARFAATEGRIDHLAEQMDTRFTAMQEQMDSRFAAVTADMAAGEHRLVAKIGEAQKQTLLAMFGTMLATVIAVSGLAFAAAGLT